MSTHPEPRNGDIWKSTRSSGYFQIAEVLPAGVSGWFLPHGEEGDAHWGHIVKKAGHHAMYGWIYVSNIHDGEAN